MVKKGIQKTAKEMLIACGLMYNKSRMMSGETVIKRAGGLKKQYFDRATQFGKRAWKVSGKKKTFIVWDCGNGWYQIIGELKYGKIHKEKKVQSRRLGCD